MLDKIKGNLTKRKMSTLFTVFNLNYGLQEVAPEEKELGLSFFRSADFRIKYV